MPNGRCRIHGGKSLVGIAAGPTKSGRYSKYLPTRLLPRFQEALNDPELTALENELALVDSRLADLLTRVDSGESGEQWRKAAKALTELQKAKRTHKPDEELFYLSELESILDGALSDYSAWAEIGGLLDRRQRLAESERKRLVETQQTITIERALLLIQTLTDIIKRHVTDRPTLAAISAELVLLTGARGGQAA